MTGEFKIKCFVSPSSELRSASPLKGEAVTCANWTRLTASPLRGEAGWKPDEGDIELSKVNQKPIPKLTPISNQNSTRNF